MWLECEIDIVVVEGEVQFQENILIVTRLAITILYFQVITLQCRLLTLPMRLSQINLSWKQETVTLILMKMLTQDPILQSLDFSQLEHRLKSKILESKH